MYKLFNLFDMIPRQHQCEIQLKTLKHRHVLLRVAQPTRKRKSQETTQRAPAIVEKMFSKSQLMCLQCMRTIAFWMCHHVQQLECDKLEQD